MEVKETIVLAGGTGFLGQVLSDYFVAQGYKVIILTRQSRESTTQVEYVQWNATTEGPWMLALEQSKALINLCGRSVDCRYTPENQEAIYQSRLVPSALLGKAIALCDAPPSVWINSSSATYYRHALDQPNDEYTGLAGTGFSVEVVRQWERVLSEAKVPGTRKIALRSALVMGTQGGPWPVLKSLARWGVGGAAGPGNQFVSWVHAQDFARMMDWLIQHPNAEGVYNAAAPDPLRNRLFMKVLRHSLGRRLGIAIPTWAVKLGAWFRQTEAELLLKSRWVLPARAQQEGFVFQHPTWAGAARQLSEGKAVQPSTVLSMTTVPKKKYIIPKPRKTSQPHWG
ncbi:MAG: TIGR01777 family oxidoreductase [Bacteroidota bacterium]